MLYFIFFYMILILYIHIQHGIFLLHNSQDTMLTAVSGSCLYCVPTSVLIVLEFCRFKGNAVTGFVAVKRRKYLILCPVQP